MNERSMRADSRRCRVLMVGQVPPPMGGVTEQVRLLVESDLKQAVTLSHLAPGRDERCRGWRRAFNALGLLIRVWARCGREKPDLAHLHTSSHWGFYEKSVLAAVLRARGVRVVLHLHGGGFAEFFARSRWQGWIRATLEKSALVLALSESWRTYLQGIAPRARVVVFRNCLDLDAFSAEPPADRPSLRRGRSPRVVFLGALVRPKGIFKLPEIARRLRTSGVIIDVLGEGPERAALQRALEAAGVADRVRLHGAVFGPAKVNLLEQADVFLLPSDVEGQPVSILEAMAAGTAVVSTDVGGVPELLAEGRGIVCPCADVARLADAVDQLLSDEAGRRRMAEAAWDYVLRHHDVRRQVGRLAELYTEPVNGPADGRTNGHRRNAVRMSSSEPSPAEVAP